MLPFVAPAITAGISALLNRWGAGAKHGYDTDIFNKLMELYSPQHLAGDTNTFFNLFKNSPMYQQGQRQAFSSSTNLANNLQRSFAQRGLGGSGMAAASMPLARTAFAPMLQQLDTEMFGRAMSMAQSRQGSLAEIIAGHSPRSIGALTAGGTLEGILPMIYKMLSQQLGSGHSINEGPWAPHENFG